MRNFLIVIILVILTSCHKDEPVPVDYGYGTMDLNGESYSLVPYLSKPKRPSDDSLYFLYLKYVLQNGYLRKQIDFSGFKLKLDTQFFKKWNPGETTDMTSVYSTSLSDGDVFGNIYFLNENDTIPDYLKLTEINSKTGEVKGIFQCSYYVDTSLIFDPDSPDTIIITNGYFETIIRE